MEVVINRFDGGIADDYVQGAPGQCAMCKQFDVFTYPFRLHPLRGMTTGSEPTTTGLKNIILGANGIMYGIGDDPDNSGHAELYERPGFGASDVWRDLNTKGTRQVSATASSESAGHFDFLVHFPETGATRKLYWATTNKLLASDPNALSLTDNESLTFTTIGQGLVHPKDKRLYFPYQDSDQTLIGYIAAHSSDPFGTINLTAFEIPNRYRAFCLSHYGDYLAIPMTVPGKPGESVVALWNRDTSLATLNETIPWDGGVLKVLNNLDGALIGISVLSGENSEASQDSDKIQVKVYEGGVEPYLIKELTATRLVATNPSVTLNHRVNFIQNNRLYFSATIDNGATAEAGLWSVGKNKLGEWTIIKERVATNDNSETNVIAAAFYGDFLSCVHTSAGTLTHTVNGSTLGSIYGATSVYETTLNPQMPGADRRKKKKLQGVWVKTLPLPAAGQVILKYRVNSLKNGAWTTIFTETTDSNTLTEAVYDASKKQLAEFTDIEFRVESTGGAIITELGYKYDVQKSQI